MKKKIKLLVAFVITISLWQIISIAISKKYDINIILPPPKDVFEKLWEILKAENFSETLCFSLGRIICGFLSGVVLGTVLGIVSGKWENVEILLKPLMSVIKSVPVASFVVLSLIWFGSEKLSVFIAFLMVLPVIYTNVLQGVKSIDVKMLQMASIYKMTFGRRLKYLWLPSVKPFFMSGSAVSAGLAWKSGIAAELIGIPEGSVGEMLYESKIYFDTSTLLAWTVIIVLASVATEKIFVLGMKQLWRVTELTPSPKGWVSEAEIEKNVVCDNSDNSCENGEKLPPLPCHKVALYNVGKKYGNENVISGFSHEFEKGVTAISGKSGGGKTTLLNIILGIEKQDYGKVEVDTSNISVVFQENRLSESFSPVANIASVTGGRISRKEIETLLSRLGLGDSLEKRVSELSGGMKRRTAIARALLYNGDVLIMDEPFKGLDEETKENVIEIVKEYTKGKTVIFVTHDESDVRLMNSETIIEVNKNSILLHNPRKQNGEIEYLKELRLKKQSLRNQKQQKRLKNTEKYKSL